MKQRKSPLQSICKIPYDITLVENSEQGREKVGEKLNKGEKGVLRWLSSLEEKYTLKGTGKVISLQWIKINGKKIKGTGKINFKISAMILTLRNSI